jgi:regulator of sirC expression with transglutaminase-like and TPR domain
VSRGGSDVLEGAFRIAREEYPNLDVPAYRARIAELAAGARACVAGEDRGTVLALNEHFFGRLGFQGNLDDYYDPRNSYLNDVIDRRTGIPITLSTLYCEVARRLGVRASGVAFPGHFLVKCAATGEEVIVDCFNARVLTREGCQELLESMYPGKPRLTDEMLRAATPREILSRMLNNLRQIYLARQDFARAVRWIEMDMELRPEAAENYRERGMLYAQAERFGKAMADLERYLRLAPDAPDRDQVRAQIPVLKKLLTRLN